MPSNQKQIIEQAKISYFPFGQAFEKETKTIKDQIRKQIEALYNQGQVKTIRKYTFNDKNSWLILKLKDIFKKFANERLEQMNGLENKADPDNIIYRYEGPTVDIKFNKLDNVLNFLDKISEGKISFLIF